MTAAGDRPRRRLPVRLPKTPVTMPAIAEARPPGPSGAATADLTGSDLEGADDLVEAPDAVLDAIESAHDAGDPAAEALEEEITEELLDDPPDPGECEPADAVATAVISDLRLPPETAWRVTAWSLVTLAAIAVAAVMFLARGVFLPIAAAGVLNLLLSPLVRGLGRWKVPTAVGALLVLGGAGLALAGLAAAVTPAVRSQLGDAPAMLARAETKLAPLIERYQSLTEKAQEAERAADALDDPAADPAAAAAAPAPEEPPEVDITAQLTGRLFGDDVFNAAGSLFTLVFATGVLLYFLLAAGNQFTRKCMELAPHLSEKRAVSVVIHDAQRAISLYLLTVTLINAGLGVVVGTAMWLCGMPNPVLWGVLACLFNFIPYVGAVFGAAAVTLVAFGTFDDTWRVALVPLVYLCCTTLEGNFITPSILGDRLNLNAPVIFAWLLLLGWLWGVPGALLAVPLLAAAAILCQHVDRLGPVGKFLVGN